MSRVTSAARVYGSVLGLLLLAGCADLREQVDDMVSDDGDDRPRTVAFECDDDRDFRARFSGDRDQVVVDTGDRNYELEYTGRDGGRRVYGDEDEVRLVVGNDDAYLRIPGDSDFQDCERRS
jgi:hypothetical protein